MDDKTLLANAWRRNPLFRILAFLDNVGLQNFELQTMIHQDGSFVDPKAVFCAESCVRRILDCGIVALRKNVSRLFASDSERESIESVIGAWNEGDEDSEKDAFRTTETEWSSAVTLPASLNGFICAIADLPLSVFASLTRGLDLNRDTPNLAEQFCVDALDEWMESSLTVEQRDQLLLACGVHPSLLERVHQLSETAPHAATDFIIDVVFPPDDARPGTNGGGDVLDWVVLSYEKNHESTEVGESGDDDDDGGAGEVAVPAESTPPHKRARTEARPTSEGIASAGDVATETHKIGDEDEDEVILTADNVDRYMRTNPAIIPHEIVVARRRAWDCPDIGPFDLENHYTTAELRALVRGVVSETLSDSGKRAELERRLGHNVDPTLASLAASASKPKDLMNVILGLHGRNISSPPPGVNLAALSLEELDAELTCAQLKAFIKSTYPDLKIPTSKKKCLEAIQARRQGAPES